MKTGKADKKRVIRELKELKNYLRKQERDAEKFVKKYKYTTDLIDKIWDANIWTDVSFIEDCLMEVCNYKLVENFNRDFRE